MPGGRPVRVGPAGRRCAAGAAAQLQTCPLACLLAWLWLHWPCLLVLPSSLALGSNGITPRPTAGGAGCVRPPPCAALCTAADGGAGPLPSTCRPAEALAQRRPEPRRAEPALRHVCPAGAASSTHHTARIALAAGKPLSHSGHPGGGGGHSYAAVPAGSRTGVERRHRCGATATCALLCHARCKRRSLRSVGERWQRSGTNAVPTC